jgi:hypothetical protein
LVGLNYAEKYDGTYKPAILQVWLWDSYFSAPIYMQEYKYLLDDTVNHPVKSMVEEIGYLAFEDQPLVYVILAEQENWRVITLLYWNKAGKRLNILREDVIWWTRYLWFDPYIREGPSFVDYCLPQYSEYAHDHNLGYATLFQYSATGTRIQRQYRVEDLLGQEDIQFLKGRGQPGCEQIKSALVYRLRFSDDWLAVKPRYEGESPIIPNAENLDGSRFYDNNTCSDKEGWEETTDFDSQ